MPRCTGVPTLALACTTTELKDALLEGIDGWTAHRHELHPGIPWGRSNSDDAPLIEGCRYFRELHRAPGPVHPQHAQSL